MLTFNYILNKSLQDPTYHLKKKKRNNLLVLLNANLPEQNDWLDSANAFSPFVSWFENGLKSYIQVPGKYLPKNQEFDTGSIFNSINYTPFKRHYEPITVLNKTKSFYNALEILKKKIYFRRVIKKKLNLIRIRKPKLKKKKRRRRNRNKKNVRIRQKYILSGFCRFKKKYKKDYNLRKLKKYNVKYIYIYDKYFVKRKKKKKNLHKFNYRKKQKRYKIRNKKLFFIQKLKRKIGVFTKYQSLNSKITFKNSILNYL